MYFVKDKLNRRRFIQTAGSLAALSTAEMKGLAFTARNLEECVGLE